MARLSDEQAKLFHALGKVQADAKKQVSIYKRRREEKPHPGRTQEQWESYWDKRISEAETTAHYCFIRSMQIDPD